MSTLRDVTNLLSDEEPEPELGGTSEMPVESRLKYGRDQFDLNDSDASRLAESMLVDDSGGTAGSQPQTNSKVDAGPGREAGNPGGFAPGWE